MLRRASSARGVEGESAGPILKQGKLLKQGHFRKNWLERHFTLRRGVLQYFRQEGDATARGELKLAPPVTVELEPEGCSRPPTDLAQSVLFAVNSACGFLLMAARDVASARSWAHAI